MQAFHDALIDCELSDMGFSRDGFTLAKWEGEGTTGPRSDKCPMEFVVPVGTFGEWWNEKIGLQASDCRYRVTCSSEHQCRGDAEKV
jgi:hypothetical protein